MQMYKKHFITLVRSKELIHTDLVLDLIGHAGYFVEQTQRLIHPLINHTKVGQNLKVTTK